MMLLLLLIITPILGSCFTAWAKNDRYYASQNVYHVAIWVMLANLGLILYTFSMLNLEKTGIQLVEKYPWISFPPVDILLGADTFAMLLIFGVNLAFLLAEFCLNRQQKHPKALLTLELLFVGLFNGYILAADIISFYIFFAAVSIPLIILISTYGGIHKKNALVRFSLYNLIGALLLAVAILVIYTIKESNIPLNTAGNVNLKGKTEYFVWFGLFFAFISRMPIWPFHYWISAINASMRNPLAFLVSSLIPLVGLYGFMRFWPNTVPEKIGVYAPIFEIICIVTMLIISLISVSHKDFRYKLFAYTTIYYLLYLIGVFLPTGGLKMNIGYSLFSCIIIMTVLSFLISHIENEKKRLDLYGDSGILCYMPRTSTCLSLFILAGIGLPITPMFWNNFIIVSEIFNYNLILGILVILALFIVSLALLEELYCMKENNDLAKSCILSNDLSKSEFFVYMSCLVMLFISFFKPLWFVF